MSYPFFFKFIWRLSLSHSQNSVLVLLIDIVYISRLYCSNIKNIAGLRQYCEPKGFRWRQALKNLLCHITLLSRKTYIYVNVVWFKTVGINRHTRICVYEFIHSHKACASVRKRYTVIFPVAPPPC